MRPGSAQLPVGIVFRRLPTDVEQELARATVVAAGRPLPAPATGDRWTWFGLWDLAAAGGTGLLAVAAIRPIGPRTAKLCAWAVPTAPWSAVGDRLLREVADTLRADGAERVVVRPPEGCPQERQLLHGAGFRPVGLAGPDLQVSDQEDVDRSAGWLLLEL